MFKQNIEMIAHEVLSMLNVVQIKKFLTKITFIFLEVKSNVLTCQNNMFKIRIANTYKTTQQDVFNEIVSQGSKLTRAQYGLRESRKRCNHLLKMMAKIYQSMLHMYCIELSIILLRILGYIFILFQIISLTK